MDWLLHFVIYAKRREQRLVNEGAKEATSTPSVHSCCEDREGTAVEKLTIPLAKRFSLVGYLSLSRHRSSAKESSYSRCGRWTLVTLAIGEGRQQHRGGRGLRIAGNRTVSATLVSCRKIPNHRQSGVGKHTHLCRRTIRTYVVERYEGSAPRGYIMVMGRFWHAGAVGSSLLGSWRQHSALHL